AQWPVVSRKSKGMAAAAGPRRLSRLRRFFTRYFGKLFQLRFRQYAQFAADRVGGKSGTQEAAIQGRSAQLIERAPQHFELALQSRIDHFMFARGCGALGGGSFDVPVG